MKKCMVLAIYCLLVMAAAAGAQETYFGKNKVQYRNFEWQYIQSDHFDLYFYDNGYDLAAYSAKELEKAYDIVTSQLKYYARSRLPVFIYNSHDDFQQTNITWGDVPEGVEGFTEAFKKRIVVHFMGSYEDFRHLLHHELTHAVIYDYLYGEFFKAFLTPNRLFNLPTWFAEGYAEYSSNGGWTQSADMAVRDATIHEYLQPLDYMEYLSYTEGYALVKYIVDTYGVDKLHEILSKGKALLTMDKALKSSIGVNSEELFEKFSREMRKRYWPDIALREEPKEFSKLLTNHEKDGSHYNEKPQFHPKGQMLAMISDRNGYSEIHLISAIDGKRVARLVKGERSADLESLRWYTSGMSFSPDGEQLVFVSKSDGIDALNFLRLKDKDIHLRKKFGVKSIVSPAWSPDGSRVAFSALSQGERDLFVYCFDGDSLIQLTHDQYDDLDPSWFPDSRRLIFSSDRPHPDSYTSGGTANPTYGQYNLQELDASDLSITPILVGDGNNAEPTVSPDGERVAFVSNRSGIDNIYVYYVDSARVIAVTNSLTNAKSPSWSPDGKSLAFSTFFKAGYDVCLLKDIVPKGDNGVLVLTDFVLGKYDNKLEWARPSRGQETVESTPAHIAGQTPAPIDPDFPKTIAVPEPSWVETVPIGDTATADTVIMAADTAKAIPAVDTLVADTLALDTLAVDTLAAAKPAAADTIMEDQYIHHAPPGESIFSPEGELTMVTDSSGAPRLPVDSINADSLDNVTTTGEYKIRPYRTRFTPDIISGGLQYDSFFGFRGQTVFIISDYLGDHQFLVATDLVNTIDQSNIQAYYLYNKLRVDFNVGIFHTKNYYLDAYNDLFSDRFYGFAGGLSWPRSKFTRVEFNAATYFIDRRLYDLDTLGKENVRVSTTMLSWIHDNVLWGVTGPVNGSRWRATVEVAVPIIGSDGVKYYAAELDYRTYLRLGRWFSSALRWSGGMSNGDTAKRYYLGGNTNRIGSISVDNSVYDINNLYFSRVV
ncbi:MAG: LpqB family beta-propeller domain-containing protein, partial [candidate division Zixibacteria bacterium]|nr:LpqB family beta-propeller domain-containing protein [candidate division Zixibacteria bacterium]